MHNDENSEDQADQEIQADDDQLEEDIDVLYNDDSKFEKVIAFSNDGLIYGIYAHAVKEVLRTKELHIYEVPRTPPGVLGMINLRGDIVPVIRFTPCKPRENTDEDVKNHKRLMIVFSKNITLGLLVEEVIGMVRIEKEGIDYEGEATGIYNDDTIYLLKPDKLF